MKHIFAIVAVIGTLAGSTAIAQDQVGVPDEIVNELQYLVGTWKFEGKLGDVVNSGTVTYRWSGKTKYGLAQNWAYMEGDTFVTGPGLMGWNAASKCVVESGYDSLGNCFLTHWTIKSPKEWTGEYTYVIAGEEIKGKGVIVKKGADEFVYEGESANGDAGRLVFRKVAVASENRLEEFAKTALGTWEASGTVDFDLPGICKKGDKYTATETYEWSSTRAALVFAVKYTSGDKVLGQGTQLIGWDYDKKQVQASGFLTTGGLDKGVWQERGDKWILRAEGILRDGRKHSSTVIVTIDDEDTHTVKVTKRIIASEQFPDVTLIYKRVK